MKSKQSINEASKEASNCLQENKEIARKKESKKAKKKASKQERQIAFCWKYFTY